MSAVHGVRTALLCGILLCAGTAGAEPPEGGAPPARESVVPKADPDVEKEARRLYEEGRVAAQKDDWERAYASQHEAYSKYPHPRIAGALGDAAFVVGKYPVAIAMLSRSLRETAGMPQEERAAKEGRLTEARSRCGTVEVDGPAGAEVRVDGVPAATLPLREPLWALPGARKVEVLLSSGVSRWFVQVLAGKSARVEVRPPPPPSPPAPRPVSPVAGPIVTPPRPSIAVPVVLGTLGVLGAAAGATAGGVLMGMVHRKHDGATVASGTLRDDSGTLEAAAVGTWIGAGVAGAAGMAAFTVAIVQHGSRPAAVTAAPVVSPAGPGFVLSGSF